MRTVVLPKGSLAGFVNSLQERWKVVGPKRKESQFAFGVIEDPGDLCLTYPTTILPPARILFPPCERLLRFQLDRPGSADQVLDAEPVVLFGVHPCDVHGINVLDEFMTDAPADANYTARRAHARIVALECSQDCSEHNLCADKGTHRVEWGFDLLLVDLGDRFFVYVHSTPGDELIRGIDAFRNATVEDRVALEKVREKQGAKLTRRLPLPAERLRAAVKASYEDPIWEDLGRRCLSCGSCTNVCPTCNCYDTVDKMEIDLRHGVRCRVWDGCQSSRFALVAGGQNFRARPGERQRHRVFKKEVYQHAKYGRSACVGCGRCSAACIADIHLTGIYRQLTEA